MIRPIFTLSAVLSCANALPASNAIAAPAPRKPAAAWRWPAPLSLRALQVMVDLGYYRGIMNKLDEIASVQPECAEFATAMRELARQFQFEAMSRELARCASALQEKPR